MLNFIQIMIRRFRMKPFLISSTQFDKKSNLLMMSYSVLTSIYIWCCNLQISDTKRNISFSYVTSFKSTYLGIISKVPRKPLSHLHQHPWWVLQSATAAGWCCYCKVKSESLHAVALQKPTAILFFGKNWSCSFEFFMNHFGKQPSKYKLVVINLEGNHDSIINIKPSWYLLRTL